MAKQFEPITIGVDTSKATLDIFRSDTETTRSIVNAPDAIDAFIRTLPQGALIAIEATNRFHETFVATALEHELVVYVIDAFRLSHYRSAVGVRAKTDLGDAVLLARYLAAERHNLRPFMPQKPEEKQIWKLLMRRAKIVGLRTTTKQTLEDLGVKVAEAATVLKELDRLIKALEREAFKLAKSLGWGADIKRVQTLPGVGPLTALGLVMAFRRHPFRSADAFVAFMGLDVRVRDSGKFKNKRKLTKMGAPELRRLLFLAGRAARRCAHTTFGEYFERQTANGKSKTAADIAVGRKIARIAFALLKKETQYRPKIAA